MYQSIQKNVLFHFENRSTDAGVDVGGLIDKLGITMGDSALGERAGTAALAYAAHKALSPVRFPPTVVLTPIVANFLGKASPDASENP